MKKSKYKVGEVLRERGRRIIIVNPENFLIVSISETKYDDCEIELQPRIWEENNGDTIFFSESAVDEMFYKKIIEMKF